ncbi:MAG: DUF3048 domain-containing protein [Defluviitaleaceae bacterium]|nr:DUF3048 domain-containing protein [Defluviitaleaceae bacterium]
MKKIKLFLMLILIIIALAACGRSRDDDDEIEEMPYIPEETTQPITEPEPDPSPPPGYAISRLTGMYITEQAYARRPFAVVYNNESRAMPQAGLMQADIVYEMLAEGSTTRLLAIFQGHDAEIIGPVRSSRHYMAQIAACHGAIFVHHGGSPMGYAAISSLGLSSLDGMRYDGTVFWRDADRRANRGLEHSSVTSSVNLLNAAESRDFGMAARSDLGMFDFFEEPTAPNPQNIANNVRVPLHASNISTFRYEPETRQYYKYIFGSPQLDEATAQQLSVANVLIQVTNIYMIPGDSEGRRNITLVGEGHGYLATMGTYQRVYWEKENAHSPTRWFDENGEPLRLNRGRTWIPIISGEPTMEE